MANLLASQSVVFAPESGEKPSLWQQFLQAALLCVLLWYVLKVMLREPAPAILPVPDVYWGRLDLPSAGSLPVDLFSSMKGVPCCITRTRA